jgi:hypothetical protein
VKLKALASWIFLSFTSFWRNSDTYEYKNKSDTSFSCIWCFTSRNWFAMQGPVAIILISSHVIFIWERGYWTRAMKCTLIKKIFDIFVETLSLYIFTIWKCIAYHRLCRDGIYFDKILVSEYKPFASPAYGVYISQLIRYARTSSNYSEFLKRHLHLRNRLQDQGYNKIRLIWSLKGFKALASWIFLSFTSFWRNSDSYEYENKSARRGAQFVPIGMPTTACEISTDNISGIQY